MPGPGTYCTRCEDWIFDIGGIPVDEMSEVVPVGVLPLNELFEL